MRGRVIFSYVKYDYNRMIHCIVCLHFPDFENLTDLQGSFMMFNVFINLLSFSEQYSNLNNFPIYDTQICDYTNKSLMADTNRILHFLLL